ncbi:DUF3429 domain-containing protein [Sphingomonas bacterium]|uniref:DUF3429 domain-containing protein n=1 Tax=Sphingomonas bacterium TaxID=1895847 RepID=UPI0015776953|nr:DUF3429 domain-containing protein [Sphingomonas bacterium]
MTSTPPLARALGFAGLLPQAAVVVMLAAGPAGWHLAALAVGYAYATLILSFLGGMWWGLAARSSDQAPAWIWLAAVAPSLVALATALALAVGVSPPGPMLVVLGVSLLGSLLVDRRLAADGLTPSWWMRLRWPLSLGLGLFTIVIAAIS